MILQALVNSADKNSDGGMDWQEFEGFGDFDLAFRTRRLMTAVLSDDILAGIPGVSASAATELFI